MLLSPLRAASSAGWGAAEAGLKAHHPQPDGGDGDDAASRSMTVWLGAWRLGLLPRETSLCVYILGAQEGKEGGSPAATAKIFALLRRLFAWEGVASLHLVLCGPEVGCASSAATVVAAAPGGESCELTVQHCSGLFHDLADSPPFPLRAPHMCVCFQPGLWGYESWEPTIRYALEGLGAPLVITSYSWEEADDDTGTLEKWGVPEGSPAWEWEVEPNPYASRRTVRRVCEQQQRSEELCDNHHWQCVRPGQYWPPTENSDVAK